MILECSSFYPSVNESKQFGDTFAFDVPNRSTTLWVINDIQSSQFELIHTDRQIYEPRPTGIKKFKCSRPFHMDGVLRSCYIWT